MSSAQRVKDHQRCFCIFVVIVQSWGIRPLAIEGVQLAFISIKLVGNIYSIVGKSL